MHAHVTAASAADATNAAQHELSTGHPLGPSAWQWSALVATSVETRDKRSKLVLHYSIEVVQGKIRWLFWKRCVRIFFSVSFVLFL